MHGVGKGIFEVFTHLDSDNEFLGLFFKVFHFVGPIQHFGQLLQFGSAGMVSLGTFYTHSLNDRGTASLFPANISPNSTFSSFWNC